MKKIICLVLALVLCVGLMVGCGGKTEEAAEPAEEVNKMDAFVEQKAQKEAEKTEAPAEEKKDVQYADTIVRLIKDKVNMISPIDIGGRCMLMGEVWNMCYDTLIHLSSDFQEYTPGLATEWDTEDFQHFHFKLREGVKFHNGEELTTDDVVYTYELGKEIVGTSLYTRCSQIESIEVLGDYEFNMNLYKTNYDWWYEMATILGFTIVNREAVEADPVAGAMIGTGKWVVKDHPAPETIIFERFDDYYGELPPTKNVTFRYISEVTARDIMMENGEADSSVLEEADIARYMDDPNYIVDYVFNNSCGYICFNTRRPITCDKNFRLACSYCFNVDEMVDIALNGYGKVQENATIWGLNTAYYNHNIPKITQDLAKAKEYLDQSSYNGEQVEIVATLGYTQRVAQVAMTQMQAIGINAYVTSCDNATLSQRGRWENNDIDVFVLQQMMGPLGKDVNVLLSDEDSNNKAMWVNQEVLDLIEKTTHEPDGDERRDDYYRIQELMFEDMPYFPTYHVGIWSLERAGMGGVDLWPNGNNDFSMVYREILD